MCGIAAFVEAAPGGRARAQSHAEAAADAEAAIAAGIEPTLASGLTDAARSAYAGGDERIGRLTQWARGLKRSDGFAALVRDAALRERACEIAARLRRFAETEETRLQSAPLAESDLEMFSARALRIRDVAWHVEQEAVQSAADALLLCGGETPQPKLLSELRKVVAVLRCIDRIEIRGRDSAGAAVQVAFDDDAAWRAFRKAVEARGLDADLARRTGLADLPALSIALSEGAPGRRPCATFLYKVAAEVGRLGDNVAELKRQVRGDAILRAALATERSRALILGHTRWASSGVISVPNCHPIDNATYGPESQDGDAVHRAGRIFVALNGDVDNHAELRSSYEASTGRRVSPRVTTDTKVIALEVERHVVAGLSVDEAFRRASAAFLGSCAIAMVTDLAPGRLFLSLRGSGQSLYVGVSEDGYFASSEVYGLVEETARYVKLDGEKERVDGQPATRGEIAILGDDASGAAGVDRRGFDGAKLPVAAKDVRTAEITTRDVDRGAFEHFFRKEVTQASRSVRRTLWGRVATGPDGRRRLPDHILPERVRERLAAGAVDRVLIVGQGTAAVAGMGVSEYLRSLLGDARLRVHALPATEMSGFHLDGEMKRTLVVAVTQSGSTADTNRAVDLARSRGALVVAIVNRRNSDITYRADAVVYTSDGRDVEMSVASTKAFYGQLVAGALLSLAVARALGAVNDAAIESRLGELAALPDLMQRVLDGERSIVEAAERHAPTRTHWAVVASGPNQVAAAEARIKLSELCYKSIALDTVEDKKHIDLSTEPLVLVLAAGNPETVLNDVVKDVAIFKAHKALPIVFAHQGERRFDAYAAAVVHLPKAPPFSSVLLCALASHLFGYHAARAIDENARFLAGIRASLVAALSEEAARLALPQTLAAPRREFFDRLQRDRFTSALNPVTAVRIASLLDITTGVGLVTPENEALLGADGGDLAAVFVNVLGEALDQCARPIDAIKHQAKIVTVGTSRPQETLSGPVADALSASGVVQESLPPVDLLDLARVQPAIESVEGLTRYAIAGLRPDGTIAPETQIRVVERRGVAAGIASRVEHGGPLTGTKRQVVATRRMVLGVGGDQRRIAILPLLGGDRHVAGVALLHLRFADALPREEKLRVLGAKLDRVRDLVTEANRAFDPAMVDVLTPEQVVLEDADDLAKRVLARA